MIVYGSKSCYHRLLYLFSLMKYFNLLSSFILLIVFNSCTVIAPVVAPIVNHTGAKQALSNASKLIDAKTGKELILLPVVHRGKVEDYARIKEYLDTLKAQGYVVFCEGLAVWPVHIDTLADIGMPALDAIADTLHLDSHNDTIRLRQPLDTLLRKFRRITGLNLMNPYDARRSQVLQSDSLLGLTTDKDIWVDYSLADLVGIWEQKHGAVPLIQYDFDTPLNAEYTKPTKIDDWDFLLGLRNDYIEKRIVESPHPKIVAVYGAGHTRRMKLDFRYLKGYTLDKTYNAKKWMNEK